MAAWVPRTSAARVRQASARGTWSIANWAIIMKNIRSMAYSISAEMEPICMAWTPTRSAPSHISSTSTIFMRKNVEQSAMEKIMFTLMAFLA